MGNLVLFMENKHTLMDNLVLFMENKHKFMKEKTFKDILVIFIDNLVLIMENFAGFLALPERSGQALNWDAGLDGAEWGRLGWSGLVGEQER